jgi:hypothetical protein
LQTKKMLDGWVGSNCGFRILPSVVQNCIYKAVLPRIQKPWLIAQLVERSLSVMKDPGSYLGVDICSIRN